MGFEYTGKVVGVTGAAGLHGIGFAIAKKFLESGAKLFICDLDQAALAAAEVALSPLGEVLLFRTDVSKEAEVSAMFKQVFDNWGRIDVLVNNAGIYPQAQLCDMSETQWDLIMNVNVKSVFLCTKAVVSYMKKTGGVIINAASFAAVLPSAGSGAYAASKSAVYSMTKTLAAELAPWQIRVNGFIPGVIETGMTKAVIAQKAEELVQAIALQRLGTPDDVAKAVLFLASADADYITGTFIEVSGGKLCVQNPHFSWN
jgi:NAD(P)-dependent dehydrogenase (short-subunit alcohol dehydrogenase family)